MKNSSKVVLKPQVWFVRHLIRCDLPTLKNFYDQRYFVLDYEELAPKPKLYSKKSGRDAIKRLNSF